MTPPAGPPREEGFSKDADKLIRRLSLVAFLLSRPDRPATAAEIRQRVEGYALMSDDAFKRRFYEDRAELAALGIGIVGDAEGEGDAELYCLPASAYYLPAIELTPDELSALAACLFVLEHRFAYSEPLRLALLSLTHGRPELLFPAAATPVSVLPEREARRARRRPAQAAAGGRRRQDGDLRLLLDRPRRGARAHRRPIRPAARRRRVVPHRLVPSAAGDPHLPPVAPALARDLRHARPARLLAAGRLRHRRLPRSAAWQLGEPVGSATVRVAADMAWWVEAHFSRCGTITPAAPGAATGRRPTPTTDEPPSSSRPPTTRRGELVSWVLSMGEAAELLEPPELRDRAARAAPATRRPARRGRRSTPRRGRRAARRRRRRRRGARTAATGAADWNVEADRFTRLATLMTYLHGVCHAAGDADETPVPVTDVCAALDTDAGRAGADVRLLNLVNFGGEGTLLWAEIKGPTLVVTCDVASSAFARPARLSPLQVDTLLLAVEILGGQLPIEHGAALHSAAQKLRRARSAAPPTVAAGERLPTRRADPRRRQRGHRRASSARHRVLVRGQRHDHDAHRRALPAGAHAGRVVLRRLVPPLAGHADLPRGHDQAGAAARRALRAAPRGRDRALPARGRAQLGALRAAPGRGLVRRRRRPLGRRARRPRVACRAATASPACRTSTSAGSPTSCCASAARRCRCRRPTAVAALRRGRHATPRAVRLGHAPLHPVVQLLFAVQLPVCLYVGLRTARRTGRAVFNWLVYGFLTGHRLPAAGRRRRARDLLRLAPRRRAPRRRRDADVKPYVLSGRRCLAVEAACAFEAPSRARPTSPTCRRPSPRRSTRRSRAPPLAELARGARNVAVVRARRHPRLSGGHAAAAPARAADGRPACATSRSPSSSAAACTARPRAAEKAALVGAAMRRPAARRRRPRDRARRA